MKTITLKLVTKIALDKKGKEIKSKTGELTYDQHDSTCLLRLLSAFDNSKYEMSDYRNYLDLNDLVDECWRKDKTKLELSLDQASFLKGYLNKFKEKALPTVRVTAFELRTLISIADQLNGR